jgi:hypothetical protein
VSYSFVDGLRYGLFTIFASGNGNEPMPPGTVRWLDQSPADRARNLAFRLNPFLAPNSLDALEVEVVKIE